MNLNRILAVSKRVFMDLKNDKRTMALIFIAPLFSMSIFGLAFSGEVHDLDVIVVNDDLGVDIPIAGHLCFPDNIIANLDPETLMIREYDDINSAIAEVEGGRAYSVIYFPANFTEDVLLGYDPLLDVSTSIVLHIDMSNVNVAEAITRAVNQAVLDTMAENDHGPPASVQVDPVFGQDSEYMDFFVPGVIAFVVYLLTTMLTLITFVGERVSGTLSRLMATPLTESEIVAGYAVTFSLIGTLQTLLLLTFGIVVFNISIVGNVLLAFIVIAILAVVCQALGIMLSAMANREAQAIQLVPFVIAPAVILSGVFWPLEAIPAMLRPASYLIPPSYAIEAMRSVMLRGWGLEMIWPQILALLLFAVVFLALATVSLKRRE